MLVVDSDQQLMTQTWTGYGPMECNKTVNVSYHNTLSIGCRTSRVGSKCSLFIVLLWCPVLWRVVLWYGLNPSIVRLPVKLYLVNKITCGIILTQHHLMWALYGFQWNITHWFPEGLQYVSNKFKRAYYAPAGDVVSHAVYTTWWLVLKCT